MGKEKIIKAWIIVWEKTEFPDCCYFKRKEAIEVAKSEAKRWDVKTDVVPIEIKIPPKVERKEK